MVASVAAAADKEREREGIVIFLFGPICQMAAAYHPRLWDLTPELTASQRPPKMNSQCLPFWHLVGISWRLGVCEGRDPACHANAHQN